MRAITINPEFEQFRDFVERLPVIFDNEGVLIRKLRNVVKVFDIDGVKINVKRFCRPGIINRVAYTHFRASKAERAYSYALRLLEMGIQTPAPIAVIIDKRGGLLDYSYFVSIQIAYQRNFAEFKDLIELDNESKFILRELARFTAMLHEKGVYHRDYSGDNILYDIHDDYIDFSIVDINRMDFGAVSKTLSYKNFGRLYGTKESFEILARHYAEYRGFDVKESIKGIYGARLAWLNRARRKPKYILKTLLRGGANNSK